MNKLWVVEIKKVFFLVTFGIITAVVFFKIRRYIISRLFPYMLFRQSTYTKRKHQTCKNWKLLDNLDQEESVRHLILMQFMYNRLSIVNANIRILDYILNSLSQEIEMLTKKSRIFLLL